MTLDPLQTQAVKLLAQGVPAPEVRQRLDISLTSFEAWRSNPDFDAEVAAERGRVIDKTDSEMQAEAEVMFFGGERKS